MMTDERVTTYLAGLPAATRSALDAVRGVVREVLPGADETISYGIPTFSLEGRAIVHVAAWKRHLSLYPLPRAGGDLDKELAPYQAGPGTLRFALDQPVPLPLIRRVVERLLTERVEVAPPDRPGVQAGTRAEGRGSATMPPKEDR
jgi:uncharacterized protein YdhG (YjbR/CyaY superfamily)